MPYTVRKNVHVQLCAIFICAQEIVTYESCVFILTARDKLKENRNTGQMMLNDIWS